MVQWLDDRLESRRPGWDLRWNQPHQWHVTTVFCPEVDDEQLDDFVDGLAEVARGTAPFELAIRGGGAFPELVRARHLIALLDDPADGLPELARGSRRAARRAGIQIESRPYQPHLTLARANRPSDLSAWEPVLQDLDGPRFGVAELALVRSTLDTRQHGRATHTPVARLPLGDHRF
ncbi:RNA 2',3'-cyclic phosphodiesterase [Luteococcus sanguinis]|uniref:RNA 2',3'-cyclic phosphodiesterase n=1 Tax=Luteococcus sanguinis TaxID=174038 RepID=A0ABW1WY23_9ACTN